MDDYDIVCYDEKQILELKRVKALHARCHMLGLVLGFNQGDSRELVLVQAAARAWLARRHVRLLKAEIDTENSMKLVRHAIERWKLFFKRVSAAKRIGRAFCNYHRRWSIVTKSVLIKRMMHLQAKCNVQSNVIQAQRRHVNVIKRQSRGALKSSVDRHIDRRGSR